MLVAGKSDGKMLGDKRFRERIDVVEPSRRKKTDRHKAFEGTEHDTNAAC